MSDINNDSPSQRTAIQRYQFGCRCGHTWYGPKHIFVNNVVYEDMEGVSHDIETGPLCPFCISEYFNRLYAANNEDKI